MACSDRCHPKLLFGFASDGATTTISHTVPLSSLLSSEARRAPILHQPERVCLIAASLDVLENAGLTFDEQVSAARKLANLALRRELQQKMSSAPLLDRIVQCLVSAQEDSIQRFVCMAICRLSSNKNLIAPLLSNGKLVQTLSAIATSFDSGHWIQAARTLAILVYRAGSQHRELLCKASTLEGVKRLLQLEQTEIQVDALRGLLPFTETPCGVRMLSAGNVWHAVLCVAANGGVVVLQQLVASVLQSALKSSNEDVQMGVEALRILCDLSRTTCLNSSGAKNVFADITCRVVVYNKLHTDIVLTTPIEIASLANSLEVQNRIQSKD